MRAFILFALLTASLAAAAASDPWYDVELIVFEYKGTPGDGSELWPADPGTPDFDNAVEPVAATEPGTARRAPVPFQALDASARKLNGLENRLARSSAYAPLLHLAWRQPVSTGAGQAVRVHGDAAGEIDGVVRISRGRFLAASADLVYRKPSTAHDAAALNVFNRSPGQADTFRLEQAKRIRGGDLTYFDHPRFGAVILVSPFDTQARKDAATSGTESPTPGPIDE